MCQPWETPNPKLRKPLIPLSDLRITKNWLFFANIRLAGRLGVCHCRVVTKQADTGFVKRAKSLREQPFIVQCSDFRCMAYRDSSGKWLDYFNGDEIKGDVLIISEG
jgi:hypothetical protein